MSFSNDTGSVQTVPFSPILQHPAVHWFLNRWQVGRRPLLISGHGRSGTTWVGNVFATARRVLYCFEPGNPTVGEHGDNDVWFRYLRPGQPDPLFEELFDTAFRGLPFNRRWRRSAWHRFVPGYRMVVKDVAAFMCLEWLVERYDPAVLIVIRHPCPTILSEIRQGTDAQQSRQALLNQTALWQGKLMAYRPVLEKARSDIDILAAIWAVRLFEMAEALGRHPEWQVISYEALCLDPSNQFKKLFEKMNLPWTEQTEKYVVHSSTNHKPGLYSGVRLSALQGGKWVNEMDAEIISAVRRQVEQFALPFYRSPADWPEYSPSKL